MQDVTSNTFLGLQIERNRMEKTMIIHQEPYIKKVLKDLGIDDCKPVPTPMIGDPPAYYHGDVNLKFQKRFQQAIGLLMYPSIKTRPDIAQAVSVLARHLHNPSEDLHWPRVQRICRYLQGTMKLGLLFSYPSGTPHLTGYSDSDYAGDSNQGKSTTGFAFTLCGGLVAWKSQLQRTVTLSSTEAEYAAFVEAVREALWIKGLLSELAFEAPSFKTVPMFVDNTAAITVAKNHHNHKRTRHVNVKNHWVREQYEQGEISISFIPTNC